MGNTFSTQGCLLLDYNPLSFDFDMGSYLFRKCPCGLNAKQRFEECLTFLADIIHVLMNYLVKGFRYTRKDSNGEIIRNSMTRVNPASLLQVFSGRRGFHLHLVGDMYFAMLDDRQRYSPLHQLLIGNVPILEYYIETN